MFKRVDRRYAIFLCLSAWIAAAAQSPRATFEAATIKPNNRGGGPFAQVLPGRLVMTYFSLLDLVAYAYDVRADQIVAGPSSIPSGKYDIQAVTDAKTSGNQMTGPMLQALLEDRFKLALHRETRQLAVFELTVAKGGTKLKPTAEGSCASASPDSAPAAAVAPGAPPTVYCGFPRTGARGLNRTMDGKGISMEALARSLSRTELRRTIIDKTGLDGVFDVHLAWSIDPSIPGLSDDFGGARDPDSVPGPAIFSAVEGQLGLKLESAKGPVEVLVIDHAENPSGN